jgi:hypothetical protein
MGANKTYQQKGNRGRLLVESDEFRRLRYASALPLTWPCRRLCLAPYPGRQPCPLREKQPITRFFFRHTWV